MCEKYKKANFHARKEQYTVQRHESAPDFPPRTVPPFRPWRLPLILYFICQTTHFSLCWQIKSFTLCWSLFIWLLTIYFSLLFSPASGSGCPSWFKQDDFGYCWRLMKNIGPVCDLENIFNKVATQFFLSRFTAQNAQALRKETGRRNLQNPQQGSGYQSHGNHHLLLKWLFNQGKCANTNSWGMSFED